MDVTVDDRNVSGREPKTDVRLTRNAGALICSLMAMFAVLWLLNLQSGSARITDQFNYGEEIGLPPEFFLRNGCVVSPRIDPLFRIEKLAVRIVESMNPSFVLLFIALSYSVGTDLKRGKILNAVTYPTMALAIGLNAYASLVDQAGLPVDTMTFHAGTVGLVRSLLGGLTCFVLMFVSFLTAGGGGGDVKIATVIGLIVGPYVGVLALAYSYIAAGVYLFAFFAVWRVIDISKRAFISDALQRNAPRVSELLRENAFSRWHTRMNGCVRMAPFFLIGTCVAVLEGAIR